MGRDGRTPTTRRENQPPPSLSLVDGTVTPTQEQQDAGESKWKLGSLFFFLLAPNHRRFEIKHKWTRMLMGKPQTNQIKNNANRYGVGGGRNWHSKYKSQPSDRLVKNHVIGKGLKI
jgi:hypothetical protein